MADAYYRGRYPPARRLGLEAVFAPGVRMHTVRGPRCDSPLRGMVVGSAVANVPGSAARDRRGNYRALWTRATNRTRAFIKRRRQVEAGTRAGGDGARRRCIKC